MFNRHQVKRLILEDADPNPYKEVGSALSNSVYEIGLDSVFSPEPINQKATEDQYILSLADQINQKLNVLVQNKLKLDGVDFHTSEMLVTGLLSVLNQIDTENEEICSILNNINNTAIISL